MAAYCQKDRTWFCETCQKPNSPHRTNDNGCKNCNVDFEAICSECGQCISCCKWSNCPIFMADQQLQMKKVDTDVLPLEYKVCIQCGEKLKAQEYNQCEKCYATYWAYIRSRGFLDAFELVIRHWRPKKHGRLRFLDVGCGAGNILIEASTALRFTKKKIDWAHLSGIELSEGLQKIAHSMTDWLVYRMDALEAEEIYQRCNVIHWYRPIKNAELMLKLEKIIEEAAPVGTIFMSNWPVETDRIVRSEKLKIIAKEVEGYWIYEKVRK